MNDDRLKSLLKSLPRQEASPGFTRRVLERLDGGGARGAAGVAGWSSLRWAMAGAFAVVAAFVAGWAIFVAQPTVAPNGNAETRRADLRAEHEELMRELESLRREASTTSPMVYLGGTDQLDVVIDLGRKSRSSRQGVNNGARPASYQTP